MKRSNLSYLVPMILLFVAGHSLGQTQEPGKTWHAVTWENDFIADDDSGYTNGIGYSWGYQGFGDMNQSPLPDWLQFIVKPLPGYQDTHKQHAISYRVAQAMFTPADIDTKELIEDDRPYAGLLLWRAATHHFDHNVSQRYDLTLGVVGPTSGAEHVQNAIHQLIGVSQAEGWDNQIGNELVFALSTEQLKRMHKGKLSEKLEYDWILAGRADAGTLHSELGIGLGFRFGRNLESSFAGAGIMPTRNPNPMTWSLKREWHGFINLYGSYVFNDITIDGNTFKDSHAVTLIHEQLFIVMGFSYSEEKWGTTFSIQDGSDTFEEKAENGLFASFTYNWHW